MLLEGAITPYIFPQRDNGATYELGREDYVIGIMNEELMKEELETHFETVRIV
jgi:hypothetical protein